MPTSFSPTLIYSLYGLGALLAVLAFGFMLHLERRDFLRRGQGAGWFRLRLILLPIAAVTAAVVLGPARLIGGPEALAVFYVGVFITGPLAWFGLHWMCGRWLGGLSRADSLRLGAHPIVLALALVSLAHMAQPWAWQFAMFVHRSEYARATTTPAPHVLKQARRYQSPEGDFTSSHWQSPEAVKVERIDLVTDRYTAESVDRGSADLCLEPNGIRWLRAADAPAARLVVYWRDDEQRLHRSDLAPPTQFAPTDHAVQWTDDPQSFVLPEAFPRFNIHVGHAIPERDIQYSNTELQFREPGADIRMSCFPAGWRSRHRVDGVMLIIQRPGAATPLMIRSRRPEPATDSGG